MLITLALLRIALRGKDGGEFMSEMKEEIMVLFVRPFSTLLGYADVVCGKLNGGTKPSEYLNSLVTEDSN